MVRKLRYKFSRACVWLHVCEDADVCDFVHVYTNVLTEAQMRLSRYAQKYIGGTTIELAVLFLLSINNRLAWSSCYTLFHSSFHRQLHVRILKLHASAEWPLNHSTNCRHGGLSVPPTLLLQFRHHSPLMFLLWTPELLLSHWTHRPSLFGGDALSTHRLAFAWTALSLISAANLAQAF